MKRKNWSLHLGLAALVATLLASSGCTTTGVGSGNVNTALEPVHIEKGMSAEDLLAAIGEPNEIRAATPAVEGTEIWVYRKVNENVALVLSGTVETPGFNPITGLPSPTIDNVYTPETSRYKEETLFLMVNGVMTAWKVQREESVHLN